MKHQKKWDRCLYCDASIAGEDALVASLHDPYCPHGKALTALEQERESNAAERQRWMERLERGSSEDAGT